MKLHLEIAGVLSILLGLFHALLPKRFDWKRDLESTTLLTRQIFYVHTFFIALVLVLFGLLSVSSAEELTGSHLGQKICAGLGVFWLTRLMIQWCWYSKKLWKGKPFETAMHYLFTGLWCYFSYVYLVAARIH